MNIEFYTPSREVSEPLVATVRNAIMHQHKLHNEVGQKPKCPLRREGK